MTVAQSGSTRLEFYYDAEGRLMKLNRNGTWEYRSYDGTQCLLRTDGGGGLTDWTVWGPTPDEVLARYAPANGGWQYYHQDAINSVVAVTDSASNTIERYLYDPFGGPDIRDGTWNTRSATAINNPWLFTGQEWRGDLQLCNYKNRWYHPQLGRFLQNDPVRYDGGDLNLYRYCRNAPIDLTDPTGLTQEQANQNADDTPGADPKSENYGRDADGTLRQGGAPIEIAPVEVTTTHLPGWGDPNRLVMYWSIYHDDKLAWGDFVENGMSLAMTTGAGASGRGFRGPRFVIRFHHPWPKYLGGKVQQILEALPKSLHDEFHSKLDKIRPRQASAAYYEALPPAARAQALQDLATCSKDFDAKHGTHLYEAMVREGFPQQ